MAKLDFVQVTGYYAACCVGDLEDFQVLETPIIGIYVEPHAFAVEALTAGGNVVELFSLCVLKLPSGKYAYAGRVFDDVTEWLDWALNLECDDVCAECREKERAELEAAKETLQ